MRWARACSTAGGRSPGSAPPGSCSPVWPSRATPDPVELWCHAAPDRWYAWGILLTGGRALDWGFGTLLGAPLGGAEGAALLREALALPARADGPLFLPYLADQDEAGGAFRGLRAVHGRADVARAVLDGVALGLRELLGASAPAGSRSSSAVPTGPVREPAWLALLAGALGVPVARPRGRGRRRARGGRAGRVGCGLVAAVARAGRAMVRVGRRCPGRATRPRTTASPSASPPTARSRSVCWIFFASGRTSSAKRSSCSRHSDAVPDGQSRCTVAWL